MKIKLIDNESITIEGGNGLGADQIKMSNGSTVQSTISDLVSDTNDIQGYIDDINEVIEEDEEVTAAALTNLNSAIETKQDILTAGNGISIDANNVISASGGGITEIQSIMPIVFGTYNESTGAYDNTYLKEDSSSGTNWLYDIAPHIHQEIWNGSSEETTFRIHIDIIQGTTDVYGSVLAYITPTGSSTLKVSFSFEGVDYTVLFDVSANHATTTAYKLSHLVATEENKFYDTGIYLDELVPNLTASTIEKLSALRSSGAVDKIILIRGSRLWSAAGTYAVATVTSWGGSSFDFFVNNDGTNIHVQGDSINNWTCTRTTPYIKPSNGIPPIDLSSAVQTSLGKADTALQKIVEVVQTLPETATWQNYSVSASSYQQYYGIDQNGNDIAIEDGSTFTFDISGRSTLNAAKLSSFIGPRDVLKTTETTYNVAFYAGNGTNFIEGHFFEDYPAAIAIPSSADFMKIVVSTDVTSMSSLTFGELKDLQKIYVLNEGDDNFYTEYIDVNGKWEKVGYFDPNNYYTKSEINTALSGKQNTLTAGDGIFINNNTISANNNICRRINLYYSENTFAQDRVLSRDNYMYCYLDGEGNDFINLPITLYQIGTIKATMVLEFPLDITSAYQSAAGKPGTLSRCSHITADGNKLIIELNPNTDGEPIDTDQDHGYHTWKGLLGAIISEIMTELSI